MKFNFGEKFKKLKLKMNIDENNQSDFQKVETTKKEFFKNLKELETGKEVQMDELFLIDDVFTYNGIPVVIYIKDHSFGSIYSIKSRKKVHLLNCSTIQEMKDSGRFHRYVSTKRKDGFYKISYKNKEYEKTLEICKNCQKKVDLLSKEKINTVKDFLESEFITKEFDEKEIKYDQNSNVYYPPNWSNISGQLRKNAHYICQKCNTSMVHDKKNLHVHHKNGVKQDTSHKNLEVLCYDCHSNEPNHEHMKKNKFGSY